MQLGKVLPGFAARQNHRPNQSPVPSRAPRNSCARLTTSHEIFAPGLCGPPAVTARDQHRELAASLVEIWRLPGCRATDAKATAACVSWFFDSCLRSNRDPGISDPPKANFDYINVHWYFVNDLNWPAIEPGGT